MKEFFFFLIFVLLITNINPIAYANKNNTSWASLKYNKTYLRTGPSKNNKVIWVYKRKGLPFKILRQKMSGVKYCFHQVKRVGLIQVKFQKKEMF